MMMRSRGRALWAHAVGGRLKRKCKRNRKATHWFAHGWSSFRPSSMLKHFPFTVVTDLKIFCLFRVPVLGEACAAGTDHPTDLRDFQDCRRTIHLVLRLYAQNIAAGASLQSYKEGK